MREKLKTWIEEQNTTTQLTILNNTILYNNLLLMRLSAQLTKSCKASYTQVSRLGTK